jgi:hypothetical protein
MSRGYANVHLCLCPRVGIHGVPFEPWSGVESVEGGNMSGYCMHSSVLFSTWHRPYLALFEVGIPRSVHHRYSHS